MLSKHTDKKEVLKLVHPCRCPSCENSCKFGSGALVGDDLKRLAEFLQLPEDKVRGVYLEEIEKFNTKLLRPKLLREEGRPYGKCIFYDELKGCSVHSAKPFECKLSMGCKEYGEELIRWFELNYYLNPKDPESIRQYKLGLESGYPSLPGAEIGDITSKEELRKAESYDDLKKDRDWEEILGLKEGNNGKTKDVSKVRSNTKVPKRR